MYMFFEIVPEGYNAAVKFSESNDTIDGYSIVNSVASFKLGYDNAWFNPEDYRRWRSALKTFVIGLGVDEESGFDELTTEEKKFCASHNIGTGEQRLLAIPDDAERDLACFNFIAKQEGISVSFSGDHAIKNAGGVWAKAITFSRCDHINIIGWNVTMPTFIFLQLQIQSQAAYEISGNLLELYKTQGIDGFALGSGPLGISDFIEETESPIVTRFAPVNGGGLRTKAELVSSVSANPYGISGCATLDEFADLMLYIVKYGKPSYL